jgi:hypothetical protein
MVPSIGRIVHFTQSHNILNIWHPAIVTKVWDNHIVNLHVFFDEQPSQVKSWVYSQDTTQNSMSWKWPDKI